MPSFRDLDALDPASTISNPNFQVCRRNLEAQLLSPSRNARSQTGLGIPLLEPPNLTCIESQVSLAWLAVPNPHASLFRSTVKPQDGFSPGKRGNACHIFRHILSETPFRFCRKLLNSNYISKSYFERDFLLHEIICTF